VLTILMAAAWRQTSYWRNSEAVFQHTLACDARNGVAHYNLALALLSQRRWDEAAAHFQGALEIKPDHPGANFNLGVIFNRRGRFDDATGHLRLAVAAEPGWPAAHGQLGVALAGEGRLAEAKGEFLAALRIAPDEPNLRNSLAWLLATCPVDSLRNGAEAVAQARRAVALSRRQNAGTLDTLAAAYAEAGRFSDAVATAREALKLAAGQDGPELAASIRGRIALYAAGKPYREPLPGAVK
jgi:Flp pilus assembly protein TadD